MLPPSDCIHLRNYVFIYIKYMPICLRKAFASFHLYYLVIKDIATVLNCVCVNKIGDYFTFYEMKAIVCAC